METTKEHQTHIVLNGFIRPEVYHAVKAGLGGEPIPPTSKVFFVAPADVSVPIGKAFQKIFNPSTRKS